MVLFIFLNLILCIENLRLSPTGFREQQTLIISLKLNLTKLCVCVCHRETMTHSQCVSLCSLMMQTCLAGLSLLISVSFSLYRVIGASLCCTQGSNELLGGNQRLHNKQTPLFTQKSCCVHLSYTLFLLFLLNLFFFCIVLKVFHTMKGIFSPCDSWLHLMTVFIIPYLFQL